MITFQVEDWDNLYEDIIVLISSHWKEVGAFNSVTTPLEPDWGMYKQLYQDGALQLITARDDQILIGYAIFILHILRHHRNLAFADSDIIFVSKEHRKGIVGYNLLKYSVEVLKGLTYRDIKVGAIGLSIPIKRPFKALAARLDFKLTELKYIREV